MDHVHDLKSLEAKLDVGEDIEKLLLEMIVAGDISAVQFILKLDIRYANLPIGFVGHSPLTYAITCGNTRLVRMLIKYGAKVNTQVGDLQKTELMYAIEYKVCVDELLTAGSNPNILDKNGNGALYYAIINRSYITVEKLIGAGANTYDVNYCGDTLLAHAIVHNQFHTIKLLLKNGCVSTRQSLFCAIKYNPKLVGLVTRITPSRELNAALLYAAITGVLSVIPVLLKYGGDPNTQNLQQENILDIVVQKCGRSNTPLVKMLIDYGVNYSGAIKKCKDVMIKDVIKTYPQLRSRSRGKI